MAAGVGGSWAVCQHAPGNVHPPPATHSQKLGHQCSSAVRRLPHPCCPWPLPLGLAEHLAGAEWSLGLWASPWGLGLCILPVATVMGIYGALPVPGPGLHMACVLAHWLLRTIL